MVDEESLSRIEDKQKLLVDRSTSMSPEISAFERDDNQASADKTAIAADLKIELNTSCDVDQSDLKNVSKVDDEVNSITEEEQTVWVSDQELPLTSCYIYQCGANTFKVTTIPEATRHPKPVRDVYTCMFEGCGKQFGVIGDLKVHQFIHTAQKSELACPYEDCQKTFSWPSHYKYHAMTHSGKRPFKCQFSGCVKAFYTRQRLDVHLRSHTGERPFSCDIEGCDKSFTTAGNLKNHSRIHSGEKPYACDYEECDKKFSERSSLKKHKVTHTGTKTYQCDVCGQLFTQSSSRNVHIRKHHMKPLDILSAMTQISSRSLTTTANFSENETCSMAKKKSPLSAKRVEKQMSRKRKADNISTLIIIQGNNKSQYTEDGLSEDAIVKNEENFSSSNVVVFTQPTEMSSISTDLHDASNMADVHEEIVYECDLLSTDLDHEEITQASLIS